MGAVSRTIIADGRRLGGRTEFGIEASRQQVLIMGYDHIAILKRCGKGSRVSVHRSVCQLTVSIEGHKGVSRLCEKSAVRRR